MRESLLLLAAGAAALVSANAVEAQASAQSDQASSWRDVATERDRLRIRGWRSAWMEALRQARGRNAAEVAGEGILLDPDAALERPAPPPGNYLCRTIKLGGQDRSLLNYVAYPPFPCRIRQSGGGGLTFTRVGGSQRPIGRLYRDSTRRMIFLGTLQLGDERRSLAYGSDTDRDMAGLLERIGEKRWRLVFPRPVFESTLDVVEIVPAR